MIAKSKINWLNSAIKLRESVNGKGLFAEGPLAHGERLMIIGGHVMTIDNDMISQGSQSDFSIMIDARHTIGPSCMEEVEDTDYLNHSCDPNAGIKGQIILVAMRDIVPGEEITLDYATVLYGDSHPLLDVYQFSCTCGSSHCRQTITAHDWKIPALRQKYRGWFSWYLQDMIEREESRSYP